MMDTDPNVSYTSTEQDGGGDVELRRRRRRSNIHELHQYALCSQLSAQPQIHEQRTQSDKLYDKKDVLSIPTLATLGRSRTAMSSYENDVRIFTNYSSMMYPALSSQPHIHEQRTPGDEICVKSATENFKLCTFKFKNCRCNIKRLVSARFANILGYFWVMPLLGVRCLCSEICRSRSHTTYV